MAKSEHVDEMNMTKSCLVTISMSRFHQRKIIQVCKRAMELRQI